MTKAEVARRLGKPETWVGRRASGATAFTLDDLDAIEVAVGISANYLFTGVNTENRHPDNPNGGSQFSVHPPGLEPGTHWLTVDEPNVIHLTSINADSQEREETAEILSFPATSGQDEEVVR